MGMMMAMAETKGSYGVLQIDAHADLNTPALILDVDALDRNGELGLFFAPIFSHDAIALDATGSTSAAVGSDGCAPKRDAASAPAAPGPRGSGPWSADAARRS